MFSYEREHFFYILILLWQTPCFISIDKCLDFALTYSHRYCIAFQCDGSLISLCEVIPPQ